MAIVVPELINAIRGLASQKKGITVQPQNSDEQIRVMAERSARRLHYNLIKQVKGYAVKNDSDSNDITLDNFQRISLPDDFYKLAYLGKKVGRGKYEPYEEAEIEHIYQTDSGYFEFLSDRDTQILSKNYFCFVNEQIAIVPETRAAGIYKFIYHYEAPALENLKVPQGFADYITYDTCIDAVGSLEDTPTLWIERAEEAMDNIMTWAKSRTAQRPAKIKRVQKQDEIYEDVAHGGLFY